MNRVGKSIVVVGSLNIDLAFACARVPTEGETLIATAGAAQPGGKGANQAVQAARLGAQVEMIGRVGDDEFGTRLCAALAADGVGTSRIRTVAGAPTGMALVLRLPGGGNSIVVAPGANHAWAASDLDADEEAIAAASVLLLQLETPIEVVTRAAALARAHGVPVVLNPAPAATVPANLLRACTYLVPNRHEAEAMTGIAIDGAAAATAAAAALRSRGAEIVVITAGGDGAFVVAPGAPALLVPAPAVIAVDTTAAGDSFCAAFAVALVAGVALSDAVASACSVAAVSVTRSGSQVSLPHLADVGAAAAWS